MSIELINRGISRKIRKEEMTLDMFVYNEMLALGYDIYSFDSDSRNKKYEDYANKAIRFLMEGKPIPKDIRDYLLKVKMDRENKEKSRR